MSLDEHDRHIYLIGFDNDNKLKRRALAVAGIGSEVCGALMLEEPNRLHLRFLPNRASASELWRILPADMRNARAEAKAAKWRVCGLFHSHHSFKLPFTSPDVSQLAPRSLLLIYDVAADQYHLWRSFGKTTTPPLVKLRVERATAKR